MNEKRDQLNKFNQLLDEMMIDTSNLIKDLSEGIYSTKAASILGFIVLCVQMLILWENWCRGPIYITVWAVGFGSILYYTLTLYQRYEFLMKRYQRFLNIDLEELGN
jgi:hypothetical protein